MCKEQLALEGFLLINKPKDISSFDCIRRLKKILKQKIKIGHTGTLDNFATGLLIICIGKGATKFAGSLTQLDKEYILKAKLGELTNTLDYTGSIIKKLDLDPAVLSYTDLQNAIEKLGKGYLQTPPIYSALKFQGTSLYKIARNKKIEMSQLEQIVLEKSRKVFIRKIELLNFDSPFFTLKATVSKGTYLRCLANDIAQNLNLPATTYELERTQIGPLSIKDSVKFTCLQNIDDIKMAIIPIAKFKEKILF